MNTKKQAQQFELLGIDLVYDVGFCQGLFSVGVRIPKSKPMFASTKESDRAKALPRLSSSKFNKALEGRPYVVDAIKNGDIQLVLITTETPSSESASKSIRQIALMQKVPYYKMLTGIISATKAIAAQKADTITVRPLQDYFKQRQIKDCQCQQLHRSRLHSPHRA